LDPILVISEFQAMNLWEDVELVCILKELRDDVILVDDVLEEMHPRSEIQEGCRGRYNAQPQGSEARLRVEGDQG